jgi:HEAT repeat protein
MELPSWVPFQGSPSDVLPGVVTPAQRVSDLRKLIDDADKIPPEEKARISEQLVAAIRTEKDPVIRMEIIHAIGAYPSKPADLVLKSAMGDPDFEVRTAACRALGKRHDEEAVQLLSVAMMSDVESDVRLTAARALGETQNPAAVKSLGDALNDNDPAMQYSAMTSLMKVTNKDLGYNVERWQQYVRGENPAPQTLAERMRQWF